jgi:hypothetical protein
MVEHDFSPECGAILRDEIEEEFAASGELQPLGF